MSKMLMRNTYAIISFVLAIIFSVSATAQSPGGVSGKIVWYKANAGTSTTNNGTGINNWANQAGGAAATSGISKPTYQDDAANQINYNPVVKFNGIDQNLTLGSTPFTDNTLRTAANFFTVTKNSSLAGTTSLYEEGTGGGQRVGIHLPWIGSVYWDAGSGTAGTGRLQTTTATAGLNTTDPVLYSFLAQGNSGINQFIKNSGRVVASGSSTISYQFPANATVRCIGSYSTTSNYYAGNIGEIIGYGSNLTTTETQQIESYLALKYGITIDQTTATDYIASDGTTKMWNASAAGTYNKNIFGIGRDDNSALDQKVSASVNARGIVTIATTNDFASANNNVARTALNNLQFLTVSDNAPASGNPTWTAIGASAAYNILSSQWKVQNTGSTGAVYLQFNMANINYDVPNTISGSTYYLAIDPNGDGNYTSDGIMVPLTNTSGALWSASYALTNGMNFTLATSTVSPGGVGAAALWVKADAGVAGITPVTSWADQTATNTFTVTGSGTFPALGANLINFNPGVQFDGSSRFTGNTSITNCTEAFAVAKIVNGTGTAASGAVLGNTLATGDNYFFHTEGGLYYIGSAVYASTNLFGNNVPYCISNADLSETPAANQKIKINGADQTNITGQDPVPFTRIPVIGARATQNLPSGSEIAEVILYTSSQAGANRQKIQSYLSLKYGITLNQTIATDYLASDGATKMWNASNASTGFNQNIFGIGRDDASALLQKISTSINAKGILTIALDNDFTAANNAAGRTTGFVSNKQFLTISDSATTSIPVWGATGAVIPDKQILNNAWQVQNTGSVGGVYLQFKEDNSNYDLPVPAGVQLYLIYDNSGIISGSSQVVTLTHSGTAWTTPGAIVFSNLAKFTLALVPSPSPGGVSGATIWLRTDLNTVNAGNLTQWDDISGNAYNFTQATTGRYPIVSSTLLNFNPRFSFDGVDDWMLNGSASVYVGNPNFTNFAVGISTTSAEKQYWLGLKQGGAAAQNTEAWGFATDMTQLVHHQNASGASTEAKGDIVHDLNTPFLVSVSSFPTTGAGLFDFYSKGKADKSGVDLVGSTSNLANFGGLSVGGFTNQFSVNNGFFSGDLCEVIGFWNKTLTASEIQKVNSYLSLKYGATLDQTAATDYLASDGSTKMWNAASASTGFNQNIFGIGRDDASALLQKISASINVKGILTIALDNDFTAANNAAGRTTGFVSDKQFLTISDNSSATVPAWTSTGAPNVSNRILNSQWQAQNPNNTTAFMQFDVANTSFDVPALAAGAFYSLMVDNDGDGNYATGTVSTYTLTESSPGSGLWRTASGVTIPNGAKFTLSTQTANPGGIGGATLWYKADAGVTNSSGVTQWNNSVSSNYNLVQQGAAGTIPTYNSSSNLINYNPSLRFDGSNDRLYTPAMAQSTSISGSGPYASSQFIVYRKGANANPLYTHSNGSGGLWNIGALGDGRMLMANTVMSTITPVANEIRLQEIDGTSGAANTYLNGGFKSNTLSGTVAISGTQSFWVGAMGTSLFSDADIAEIVLYNAAQSSAGSRLQIESYLALKYGITIDQTIATDYIASDGTTKMWNASTAGAYKYNVFGVGRDDASALYQKISASVNAGGIVTVATENDFASANNGTSRNDVITNKQFLTISNNSVASPAWGSIGAVITGKQILNNAWSVQNINGTGGVYLQFNAANTNWPLSLGAGTTLYLVYDNTGSISAGSTVVSLVQNGNLWTTGSAITFSNLAKFTLAIGALDPGVITGNQSVCQGSVPSGSLTETTTASGGCGITGYQWQSSVDNGITWTNVAGATSTNYTFTAAISVQTLYRRSVADACAAIAYSDTITVGIYGAATAGTIGGDQTICNGDVVATLTNTATPTGGDGTYTYQWQSSSDNTTWTNISGAITATYAPGALTATTYFRRNVTSCSSAPSASSAAVLVIVNEPAVITTQPVSKSACVGATTGFDLFASGSGLTYQWQQRPGSGAYTDIADVGVFSGTTTSTLKLTGVTSAMNNYSYRCVITSPCTATLTSNVVLLSVLVAINNNISADQSICAGSSAAVLTGTTSSAYTYLWESSSVSASSGFVSASGTNTTYDYNPNPVSTLTWYRRLVKNVACSTYSNVVSIAVNLQPAVVITNPAAVCAPATVNITAAAISAGSTSGLTYTYFTDAAATTALVNPNAVNASGTYYIKGSTASGCYDVKPVTVIINPLPTATISYGGLSYCPTGTATVTQTGQTGGTYSSTPGLSINASTGAVDLVTSIAGIYTVSYSFSNGTCGNTTTATITIDSQPSVVITNPAAVCSPATVNITTAAVTAGSSSGLIYTYFTDAVATTALSNPNAITASGTYYIKGATTSGCYDIKPVTVTINSLPTATILYAGSSYCGTGMAAVTQTGQNGGIYSSTAGLSINASTGAVNLASSTAGTYTVKYSFSNGTCSSSTTADISIDSPPLVIITNPAAVCAPGMVDITAPAVTAGSASGLTYTYYADAAATMPLINPGSVVASGTYYVKGISGTGCTTLAQPVDVIINPQPVLTLSADKTLVCKWDAVSLSATSAGSSLVWQQVGTGNNVIVYPSQNTTYTATATDALGCTNTDHINISVRDFKVILTATPNPVMSGTMVTLTPSANSSFTALAWAPSAFFQNQQAAVQTMQITDSSKTFAVVLQSADGCVDTASVFVTVNDNTKELFIPNAFTPNNDGKNDVFKVYGTSVKGVSIQVFNQWGNLMIETTDNNRGWDGTYKGKQQPVGVYLYVIKIQLYNNGTVIRNGTVNLIR